MLGAPRVQGWQGRRALMARAQLCLMTRYGPPRPASGGQPSAWPFTTVSPGPLSDPPASPLLSLPAPRAPPPMPLQESEYAAWVLVHGYAVNHTTVAGEAAGSVEVQARECGEGPPAVAPKLRMAAYFARVCTWGGMCTQPQRLALPIALLSQQILQCTA